jgi:hypothetical protein
LSALATAGRLLNCALPLSTAVAINGDFLGLDYPITSRKRGLTHTSRASLSVVLFAHFCSIHTESPLDDPPVPEIARRFAAQRCFANYLEPYPEGAEQLDLLRHSTRSPAYMLLQQLFNVGAERAPIFLRELLKFGL